SSRTSRTQEFSTVSRMRCLLRCSTCPFESILKKLVIRVMTLSCPTVISPWTSPPTSILPTFILDGAAFDRAADWFSSVDLSKWFSAMYHLPPFGWDSSYCREKGEERQGGRAVCRIFGCGSALGFRRFGEGLRSAGGRCRSLPTCGCRGAAA